MEIPWFALGTVIAFAALMIYVKARKATKKAPPTIYSDEDIFDKAIKSANLRRKLDLIEKGRNQSDKK
jgi:hypothetical protein